MRVKLPKFGELSIYTYPHTFERGTLVFRDISRSCELTLFDFSAGFIQATKPSLTSQLGKTEQYSPTTAESVTLSLLFWNFILITLLMDITTFRTSYPVQPWTSNARLSYRKSVLSHYQSKHPGSNRVPMLSSHG